VAASSLAPERFLYLLPEAFFAPPVVTVVDPLPRPDLLLWQVRFACAFSARRRKRASQEEQYRLRSAASESNRQEEEEDRHATEEEKAESAAREVLSVTEDASMAEITNAYRKLALIYHPDKVAHLAPENRISYRSPRSGAESMSRVSGSGCWGHLLMLDEYART
jgi:hypothetical protein